jgi:hypothetical protein
MQCNFLIDNLISGKLFINPRNTIRTLAQGISNFSTFQCDHVVNNL